MSYLKPSICAVLLVMTLSSTALAGNIVPRSGNIRYVDVLERFADPAVFRRSVPLRPAGLSLFVTQPQGVVMHNHSIDGCCQA